MVPLIATPRQKSGSKRTPNRVVLALLNAQQAETVRLVLRRLGWSVQHVATAAEARQLVAEIPGGIVILGAELADESGWLTCAKLTQPPALCTVLLIGPDTPRNRMMARGAGAAALLADPVEVAEWIPPARRDAIN